MYTLEDMGMRCWEQSLWVAVLKLVHEDYSNDIICS